MIITYEIWLTLTIFNKQINRKINLCIYLLYPRRTGNKSQGCKLLGVVCLQNWRMHDSHCSPFHQQTHTTSHLVCWVPLGFHSKPFQFSWCPLKDVVFIQLWIEKDRLIIINHSAVKMTPSPPPTKKKWGGGIGRFFTFVLLTFI